MNFYVWLASVDQLPRYKDMGCKGVIYNQRLNPRNQALIGLETTCRNLGLELWRYPNAFMEPVVGQGFEADMAAAGFTLVDEPVMHSVSPAAWLSQATDFRRRGLFPIFGNLEGDKFSKDPATMRADELAVTQSYINTPDFVTCDFYGWARVRYNADKTFMGWYGLDAVIRSFRILQKFRVGDQKTGIVLDTGNQFLHLESRAPTVQEFRGQMWYPFLLGAKIGMLFPQRPGSNETAGKTPIYETFGSANDCIPPEIELEFRLNKPNIDLVESWGVYDTFVEDDKTITVNWAGGKKLIYDKATYNVSTTLGGMPLWAMTNQSLVRKASTVQYPEQTAAQALIESMKNTNNNSVLQKRNDELMNGLKAVSDVLRKLGVIT